MFRPFLPLFFAPAWVEAGYGRQFHPSDRHSCRGGGGGRGWEESRVRRGDMKFILLELLAERPQHGYELIKQLETRRGGFRRLSPGSVYPTLQLLEEGGYLTSEQIDGKRVYTVTEAGRQLLEERNQQTASGSSESYRNPATPSAELVDLRKALVELTDAVAQLARSGDLEQANQARELLVQTKREIYRMLADQ